MVSISNGQKGASSDIDIRNLALCCTALFIHGLSAWAVNGGLYPSFADFFGLGRELATALLAIGFAGMGLVSAFKPTWLEQKILGVIGFGCAISAGLVLALALSVKSPFAIMIGLAFRCTSEVIAVSFMGLALCSLKREIVVPTVVGITAVSTLAATIAPALKGAGGAMLVCAILVASIAFAYRPAQPMFSILASSEPPADIQLVNPNSFIPLKSGLYGCTFLYGATFGFSLVFGNTEHGFIFSALPSLVLFAFIAWFLATKPKEPLDALFSLAVVLAVAGFASIPVASLLGAQLAGSLFSSGLACLKAIILIMAIAVARRSPYAILPTLCALNACGSLGVLFGAASEAIAGIAFSNSDSTVALISMAALACFVGFLWTFLRTFSFTSTIERLVSPTVVAVNETDQNVSFDSACEAIGREFGLTKRETEILALLARGRNAPFIQEKYIVSRNTVKTHIRHIYAKTNVHSQQEIIDFVENRRSATLPNVRR